MTTTNGLAGVLQNYYRLQTQKTAAAAGLDASASTTTAAGAKTDTATISKEAIRALLASQAQAAGSSDPWATTSGQDATQSAAWPSTSLAATTPQEALQQSQQFMLQAQQAFLGGDRQTSSDSVSQAADGMGSMMTAYMQQVNRQVAQSIQVAQARMTGKNA